MKEWERMQNLYSGSTHIDLLSLFTPTHLVSTKPIPLTVGIKPRKLDGSIKPILRDFRTPIRQDKYIFLTKYEDFNKKWEQH